MTKIWHRPVTDRAMRTLALISLFSAFITTALEIHRRSWPLVYFDAALVVLNATGALYYHRKIQKAVRR